MLNQYVSMDDGSCPPGRSTALVAPCPDPEPLACDPILAGYLERLAAASGCPSPHVLPAAAVHLLSVPLPLKTARQRRAALPFAAEPVLGASLEETQLALGPEMTEGHYLCAAVDRGLVEDTLETSTAPGPVLADYLAVPPPFDTDAWSLWCGEAFAYLRFADGGGIALRTDVLADLWRAQGRPELHLWHGTPPVGLKIARRIEDTPVLDPALLKMDLRPASHRLHHHEWRRLGRFALIAGGATCIAQLGLVQLDAMALAKVAGARAATVETRLADRGIDSWQITQPTDVIMARLTRTLPPQQSADPFLSLLSATTAGLASGASLTFRDLRYDDATGALSVLITASDLGALQEAEMKLQAKGLTVTSGAATRTDGRAEMEIIVRPSG